MSWDAERYLRFAESRTRPARDLLAHVPLDDPRVCVDLGCGPGNSTVLLTERWPGARVLGIDNSPAMLERARRDHPSIEFVDADIAALAINTTADLIFANASLHWVQDHARLLPGLLGHLAPDGVLAVQMPDNFAAPSHQLMRMPGTTWEPRLTGVESATVLTAEEYHDVLSPFARRTDIWRTTYLHTMDSAEAIVDWVSATGLRPYLAALPDDERPAYLAAYTAAIDTGYPARADGCRVFPFSRLFIVAQGRITPALGARRS